MYRPTEQEQLLIAQQQVLQVESTLWTRKAAIEEIGDLMPGCVMLQDLTTLTNVYMNRKGCEFLKREPDELAQLGPEYYHIFFVEEEVKAGLRHLEKIRQQQDTGQVYSYFQRVRARETDDYVWHYTCTKFLREPGEQFASRIINVSNAVSSLGTMANKVNRLLEENEFMKKNFRRYALLTKREKEVIRLLAHGHSTSVISDMLFLSKHTVDTHRKNINRKLETGSFAQLLRFATAYDLL